MVSLTNMMETHEVGTVCIAFAQGCPRAKAETALLFRYFEANNWRVVDRVEDANLALVSTCGVVIDSEQRSKCILALAARRLGKGARLVVVGCLAGMDAEGLRRRFRCITVTSEHISKLDKIINAKVPIARVADVNMPDPYIRRAKNVFDKSARLRALLPYYVGKYCRELSQEYWKQRRRPHRRSSRRQTAKGPPYYLKIAKGCTSECTYCAIRFSSGPLVSKPLDTILAEFRAGLADGHEVFLLVAGDVGAYGQDIGSDIAELLAALLEHEGRYRLRLCDFHPLWLGRYSERLAGIIGEHADHLDAILIPIQSGSDRILAAMKREHTAAEAADAIRSLALAAPKVGLSCHVLVGFSGETDADFAETVKLVRSLPFESIVVYKYCDRPGTEASRMAGKISRRAMDARVRKLFTHHPRVSLGT